MTVLTAYSPSYSSYGRSIFNWRNLLQVYRLSMNKFGNLIIFKHFKTTENYLLFFIKPCFFCEFSRKVSTSHLPAQKSMAHSPTSYELMALASNSWVFFHPFQSEICSRVQANPCVPVRSSAALCDTHLNA